jgi:hypothetical protein
LPYSGVTAVIASRYAVTTQEMWVSPPRSPTIVGSAVETIVWSSDARSITSISPLATISTWRPSGGAAGVSVVVGTAVIDATALPAWVDRQPHDARVPCGYGAVPVRYA